MRRYLTDYFLVIRNLWHGVTGSHGLQRSRRFVFLLLFLVLHPALVFPNRLFMALDKLFYPDISKVGIKGPLFIVGNHRTGSTALHRLLARDTDNIVTFRMLDLFFPSVIQKRMLCLVAGMDRLLRRPVRRIMDLLDGYIFSEYSIIHDAGFFKTEEDEFALLHVMTSACLMELFPREPRFRRYFYVDSELPAGERHIITSFYREFITRQLFHKGPENKLVVSKNPLFTGKVATLAEAFPDARFIILVRSPLFVLPSTASLHHFVWHRTGALPETVIDKDTIKEIVHHFYNWPEQALAHLPPSRVAVIRYDDLMEDMAGVIRNAFKRLELPITPGLAEAMEEARCKEPYRSKHAYTLEKWGFTVQEVVEEFRPVFERYGFPIPKDEPS